MPIWLRQYTFNLLKEHFEEKNKANKQQSTKNKKQILRPNIKPTYKTKASNK